MTSSPIAAPILEVSGLDSFYGELQVLRGAALDVRQGEVVALFGPNGHGKSTLLKAIAGIHPPKAGEIRFKGETITGLPSDRIVAMGMAYIPEARNLFREMTVMENLRLGAYNRRARTDAARNLELVFALFPRLAERKDQIAATLSGGESRMLAVGRGLMSSASLLLIDEPSIGLSPLMKKTVFSAIHRIKTQTDISIMVVEQEVDYPLALADRIYLLKKGQVIMAREAGAIDKAEIEQAYF
ncbi:MAG: ABC transporter ATP-binding protein [Desulfobacteraceae bacterium]|jgi:branched-chain amino acid transport system ATP-binding protein|nr:ABC transporter ATP-binding protein [Desulfobacteraceae bacterium]